MEDDSKLDAYREGDIKSGPHWMLHAGKCRGIESPEICLHCSRWTRTTWGIKERGNCSLTESECSSIDSCEDFDRKFK
jgi:hypothetical protein